MAKNKRQIKKANHGKRPCSPANRRRKAIKTPR